jgi:ferredoxin
MEPILAGLGLEGMRVAANCDRRSNSHLAISFEGSSPPRRFRALRAFNPLDQSAKSCGWRCASCIAPRWRLSISSRCPSGAPFGAVELKAEGCTLCLACVSARTTGALLDDPERPMLRFVEDACVQCGLCKATCPEGVISLVPRIDFRAATASASVLKEEAPFPCVRCGKPFGVKSTIDRVVTMLEGKHWMYQDSPSRLDVIKMCEDCRVVVATEEGFDPYGAPPRPKLRTTDDYLQSSR